MAEHIAVLAIDIGKAHLELVFVAIPAFIGSYFLAGYTGKILIPVCSTKSHALRNSWFFSIEYDVSCELFIFPTQIY